MDFYGMDDLQPDEMEDWAEDGMDEAWSDGMKEGGKSSRESRMYSQSSQSISDWEQSRISKKKR